MITSQTYIIISIIVLLAIAIAAIVISRQQKTKLSRLAALAFIFVICGIIFGDSRLIGYSLMGVGVIIAIIDIVQKSKTNK